MWREFSKLVDDVVLSVEGFIRGGHALRDSLPGPGPAIEELIAEQRARPPEIKWPARFERRVGRIKVCMPVSSFDTFADFHPAASRDADTLFIYHHGLAEFPHDGSAARILTRGRLRSRVDWFAIRGAHHDSPGSVGRRLTNSAENFARGLASSVFTARALADRMRGRYRHVVLGGMSMGGVITLIEYATGPQFDLYVPLMAGPDLESVLLRSAFSRIVCPRYRTRTGNDLVTNGFDIVGRCAADGDGPAIRPALGSYDQLFDIRAQQAAYARVPRATVTVVSGGHITGAMSFGTLAGHVERALDEELWQHPVRAREPVRQDQVHPDDLMGRRRAAV